MKNSISISSDNFRQESWKVALLSWYCCWCGSTFAFQEEAQVLTSAQSLTTLAYVVVLVSTPIHFAAICQEEEQKVLERKCWPPESLLRRHFQSVFKFPTQFTFEREVDIQSHFWVFDVWTFLVYLYNFLGFARECLCAKLASCLEIACLWVSARELNDNKSTSFKQ